MDSLLSGGIGCHVTKIRNTNRDRNRLVICVTKSELNVEHIRWSIISHVSSMCFVLSGKLNKWVSAIASTHTNCVCEAGLSSTSSSFLCHHVALLLVKSIVVILLNINNFVFVSAGIEVLIIHFHPAILQHTAGLLSAGETDVRTSRPTNPAVCWQTVWKRWTGNSQ